MGSRSRRKVLRQVRNQGPPVIRASSIAEMLGTLPVLFGFHPEESLVVVALDGPRSRAGFRMRVDLLPTEDHDLLACQVADVLRSQHTDSVLLVAYSADPTLADPLIEACWDRLVLDGVTIVEAVRCDSSRYWSYKCHDSACCPPEGTPYDVASSAGMALAVAEGIEVLPDRAALAARLAPPQGQLRTRMQSAVAEAVAEMASIASRTGEAERSRALAEVGVARVKPTVLRALDEPGATLEDAEVAQILVWCSLSVVRDIAWAQMTPQNAPASFAVWSQVARRAVPPFEPAVLSLAGFAAWIKGDGAAAWCAVERAEDADPDYSMMHLLRETLTRVVPPSAWQPFDEALVWSVLDR